MIWDQEGYCLGFDSVKDLDVGVYGRVTSPRNGSMASVQVGKAVFVKESYTTLGIEPRTYS